MKGGKKRLPVLVVLLALVAATLSSIATFKLFQGALSYMKLIDALQAKTDLVDDSFHEENSLLKKRLQDVEAEVQRLAVRQEEIQTQVAGQVQIQQFKFDIPDEEKKNGIGADGKYHWYPEAAGEMLGWKDMVKKAPENEARDPQMLVLAEEKYREKLRERGPWPTDEQEGYDFYTRAFYPCRSLENTAPEGSSPEGGKWMCELHQLKDNDIVYSVGCNGDIAFEAAIHAACPGCDIHTFDHSMDAATTDQVTSNKYIHFHPWGVTWPGNTDPDSRLKTVPEILSELKHDRLAIFKIDCEGCEWGVFEHIFEGKDNSYAPFDQVQVEVHDLFDWGQFGTRERTKEEYDTAMDRLKHFIRRMEDHGYRLFHWELNMWDFRCAELAFIHERVVRMPDDVAPKRLLQNHMRRLRLF